MKSILTNGDVARICGVAPRTASRWFDRGLLPGYRIPGGRDRRVRIADLEAFARQHGLTHVAEALREHLASERQEQGAATL